MSAGADVTASGDDDDRPHPSEWSWCTAPRNLPPLPLTPPATFRDAGSRDEPGAFTNGHNGVSTPIAFTVVQQPPLPTPSATPLPHPMPVQLIPDWPRQLNADDSPTCDAQVERLAVALSECFPDTFYSRGEPPEMAEIHLREDGRRTLRKSTQDTILSRLDKAVSLYTQTKTGLRKVRPSRDDRVALLQREWPRLRGLVTTPYFTPDGEFHDAPGYNPATRLYLDWPHGPVPDVSHEEAAAVFDRLLDFPFATNSDYAHAFGLMLQQVLRPAILGATPLHLVTAAQEGAGKTFVGEVAAAVAGQSDVVRPLDQWVSEATRQITSYLLEEPQFMLLDNLEAGRPMDAGSILLQAISAPGSIGLRPMGSGVVKQVAVRCTWVATGIGIGVNAELARRVVPIRLLHEPNRTRKTKALDQWVFENRPAVIGALRFCVRLWQAAGGPAAPRALSGFDSWSRWVGGVTSRVVKGFLDPDHRPLSWEDQALGDLFDWWPTGSAGHTALLPADVVQYALASSSPLIKGQGSRSDDTRMGILLAQVAESGRVIAGWRLERFRKPGSTHYRPVPEVRTPVSDGSDGIFKFKG